ncbi:hypothetical protein [Francisella sp. Scap27]|uniref:hypothetical protein n=1 Tax=Francisella sp. Scap27 TaxID=2589986 RepID=UPI0021174CA9|nr:hypothetical protein [Francisella sp. Scap27]
MKKNMIFRVVCIFFAFIYADFAVAYFINEDGKQVPVSKSIVTEVDDLEMKEGEALTNSQIKSIASSSGSISQDL